MTFFFIFFSNPSIYIYYICRKRGEPVGFNFCPDVAFHPLNELYNGKLKHCLMELFLDYMKSNFHKAAKHALKYWCQFTD